MRSRYLKLWAIIFVISVCLDQFAIVFAKRSGSYTSSRGSSRGGSRGFSTLGTRHPTSRNYGTSSGGGGHGRGRWTDRIFGRGSSSRNAAGGGGNRGVLGGIMGGGHANRGTNYGGMGSGRKSGGLLGGIGSKLMGRGGRGGGYKNSMFRNSGIGSRSRSNTFKNMIVGAAAGFLAYKAGKAIIKNVAAPMMWNNRPYYWGSQYYPHHHQQPYGQQPYGHGAGSYGAGSGGGYPGENSKTMCRMPIDVNDPVLGQVYMEDNTRPKEIVWSCEYSEDCCGYECCPREY